MWLMGRKDIEEGEETEEVSYDTPRYFLLLHSNKCYSRLVQTTFIRKKVTLTYFKPENSPRKEDLVTARQKKIT